MVNAMQRHYYKNIWADFDRDKHLVLLSGARQVGKTTLAKQIASEQTASVYFNYDIPADRARLLDNPAFFEEIDRGKGDLPLVILDEIHKYSDWKNYLKGIYDGYSDEFRFLVSGSGRLDLSHRKGDSLAGRYFQFHLFPFTLGEMFATAPGPQEPRVLSKIPADNRPAQEAWETMFQVSGFPEPFLAGSKRTYRRWAATYHSQVVRDDIRDEFSVRRIDRMEALYFMLAERVGSPFSAAGVARTLKVSHSTISSWISVFERFFLIFQLRPYSRRIARSLVREPKIYFFDYGRVTDDALRFENMVAVELARAVTLWSDFGLGDYRLWYLRNKEKQEVDFLVTESGKPQFMVETKLSDPTVSPYLRRFQNVLGIPAIQLVKRPDIGRSISNKSNRILVASAADWLSGLG